MLIAMPCIMQSRPGKSLRRRPPADMGTRGMQIGKVRQHDEQLMMSAAGRLQQVP